MQIHATDEVEGVPLLEIRALFRQAGLNLGGRLKTGQ
jgi:hypothetical protein